MMSKARRLLIVFHTQSGNTGKLAHAVFQGSQQADGIQVRMLHAFDAQSQDLMDCDGLLIGTPENFGYMSGAIKDFFDRTFYPCEGKLHGLPFGLFISAGNDGRGAEREIKRIAAGYGWRQTAETLIVQGNQRQRHWKPAVNSEKLLPPLSQWVFL